MAIRYSGDVEIRMRYDRGAGVVRATVTDGARRVRFVVPARGAPSSEGYDRLAALLATRAEEIARKRRTSIPTSRRRGRLKIRRVFQAPCPKR